ncbi:hypothetical protein QE152_g36897 [Popillia japonica]|uniref:Uncharacterized protein n=1 Tax=Popillia japonica TaxID=7064 RepID=A0AAW1ICH3_POPJA
MFANNWQHRPEPQIEDNVASKLIECLKYYSLEAPSTGGNYNQAPFGPDRSNLNMFDGITNRSTLGCARRGKQTLEPTPLCAAKNQEKMDNIKLCAASGTNTIFSIYIFDNYYCRLYANR